MIIDTMLCGLCVKEDLVIKTATSIKDRRSHWDIKWSCDPFETQQNTERKKERKKERKNEWTNEKINNDNKYCVTTHARILSQIVWNKTQHNVRIIIELCAAF